MKLIMYDVYHWFPVHGVLLITPRIASIFSFNKLYKINCEIMNLAGYCHIHIRWCIWLHMYILGGCVLLVCYVAELCRWSCIQYKPDSLKLLLTASANQKSDRILMENCKCKPGICLASFIILHDVTNFSHCSLRIICESISSYDEKIYIIL